MQAAAAANCHIRKETKILQCICADCLCDLRSLEALFNTDMHDNKKSWVVFRWQHGVVSMNDLRTYEAVQLWSRYYRQLKKHPWAVRVRTPTLLSPWGICSNRNSFNWISYTTFSVCNGYLYRWRRGTTLESHSLSFTFFFLFVKAGKWLLDFHDRTQLIPGILKHPKVDPNWKDLKVLVWRFNKYPDISLIYTCWVQMELVKKGKCLFCGVSIWSLCMSAWQ